MPVPDGVMVEEVMAAAGPNETVRSGAYLSLLGRRTVEATQMREREIPYTINFANQ